jgi:hypothetical protein
MPGFDNTKTYEQELKKAIAKAKQRIRKIYEDSIVDISVRASTIKLKKKPFSLNNYPSINEVIESKMDDMHKQIYKDIVKSVQGSWDLSNKKNDEIVDKRLAGKKPASIVRQILYDPNKQAYESFLKRKDKGLDLSERVWNSLSTYKKEMEQALGLSMNKGQSALTMATELKQYLNNPDKLFRRVSNEEGKLVLSKAAREYHPGQGVYRSSFKNALRLSRTENNIAFRWADWQRWQNLPFVTGIEIKTSNNHPKFDICDTLAGRYPKSFKWPGWHPQCICFQVPIMMNEDEYDKLEDSILGIADFDPNDVPVIEKPPDAFGLFLRENEKRIAGWASPPYWLRDNPDILKLGKRAVKGKLNVDFSVLDLRKYISMVNIAKYKNVFPELSIEEKASIHGYTDTEYYSLNSYLRGLNVSAERANYFDNYRNLLNNALDAISTKFEGTTYRGTRLDETALNFYRNAFRKKETVTHDYFTSTSKDPARQFSGNVQFIIHSKKGRFIEPISYHEHEKEVLFKAGAKFKVVKMDKRSSGVTYITLEEVD